MSSPLSHQTVPLAAGKHASSREGVCVMELASMLAGEAFTDRPRSVCPVIASYLRAVNDLLDAPRRQLLYPYAAAAVGTAGDEALREHRLERCREAFAAAASGSPMHRLLGRSVMSIGLLTPPLALEHFTVALVRAIRRAGGTAWHRTALTLADDLIAMPADAVGVHAAAALRGAPPARRGSRPSSRSRDPRPPVTVGATSDVSADAATGPPCATPAASV